MIARRALVVGMHSAQGAIRETNGRWKEVESKIVVELTKGCNGRLMQGNRSSCSVPLVHFRLLCMFA
jgi:hypothetical protein